MALYGKPKSQQNATKASVTNNPDGSQNVRALTLLDGTLYSGRIVDGLPEGRGIIRFYGNIYFRGEFVKGRPEGPGELQLLSGEKIQGEFTGGIFLGTRIVSGKQIEYTVENRQGRLVIRNKKVVGAKQPEPAPEPEPVVYVPEIKDEPIVEVEETPFEEPAEEPQVIERIVIKEVPAEPIIQERIVEKIVYVPAPVEPEKPKDPYVPHFPVRKTEFTNGVKEFNDGTYEGDLRNGKRHGKGKLVKKDGTVIIGDFSNDRPHGQVTADNESADSHFKGEYRNGEMRYGTLVIRGMTYTGEFKRNLYHGAGRFIGTDGTVLEGNFRWGKYIGPNQKN